MKIKAIKTLREEYDIDNPKRFYYGDILFISEEGKDKYRVVFENAEIVVKDPKEVVYVKDNYRPPWEK